MCDCPRLQAWLQSELLVRGDKLHLTELPQDLLVKKGLKELYLSHNSLAVIPPTIANFKVSRPKGLKGGWICSGQAGLDRLPAVVNWATQGC